MDVMNHCFPDGVLPVGVSEAEPGDAEAVEVGGVEEDVAATDVAELLLDRVDGRFRGKLWRGSPETPPLSGTSKADHV